MDKNIYICQHHQCSWTPRPGFFGRLLLEGLQYAAEVAAPDGHGRVVGASRPTR
jgi:hypothetical protein